ncbi:Glyoxalase-like domain-containing protein [Klenkia marina]|uniref:Glyoxalase-like domain-containing protein n=1 Tax=Klenkia marina TaxID=1960309 RepID=A0A1G4YMI0_9ACTN|nr:VOC family protein [Klenkia marina]SCX54697.1 Glyoxalase-like domain-containing protein [Klenkia marina]
MRTLGVTTNLHVDDIAAAEGFWAGFLGLRQQEFSLGWVARYTDPDTGAHVQLVTGDATAPEDSAVTVRTDDVDAAYAEARAAGYEIVHPLTTESWGVRRFFVRAPGGTVVNVAQHRD